MSETDRLAVLLIDEIAIKVAIEYDKDRNVVDGFADDGDARTSKLANEALVFMVNSFSAEGNYRCPWYSAGGIYSRPYSLAAVGDYRRRIYAIYVGGT